MRREFNLDGVSDIQITDKVNSSLVSYVYAQADFALFASLLCATIVFIGLFILHETRTNLYIWFGVYLLIAISRIILVNAYKHQHFPYQRYTFWRNLYIVGAALGGLSWGLAAIILLPESAPMERMLIVLMLAGVTAGVVPLSLGIAAASISFLVFALVPFIIDFASLSNTVYILFAAALTLYLIYSIVLTIKGSRTIRNSIELQYENAALLRNLSEAKYQLELSNDKLEYAASHDPLTQVSNRNLFEVRFHKAIQYASSHQKRVALLYLDLDAFKTVNDVYGHHVGDLVLKVVVSRLIHFLHSADEIARLGGDEFAIILNDVNSIKQVEQIASQLCQLVAEPIVIKGMEKIIVTASIGISLFPDDEKTADGLLSLADKSMYAVKEHGGNHFYFAKEYV